MRFRAPDDKEAEGDALPEEDQHSFEDKIKLILKISEIPDKYILNSYETDTSDYKLKVLMKFTQLCREEIFPRHNKAMGAIQSKADELFVLADVQRRQTESLLQEKAKLEEGARRLEAALTAARQRHAVLIVRLRDTLRKLQDRCEYKTAAERQLATELTVLKRKAEDLRVAVIDSKAKSNYLDTQVNAQTEIAMKNSKPLYLDNNRAIFMRKHLNSMRLHIEELVRRVKTLKTQTKNFESSVCLSDDLNSGEF